jgi:hypothetical protein
MGAVSGDTQGFRSQAPVRALDVAGVCLLVAAVGWVSLVYPFGRDQGEYAVIGSEVLAGKVAYRDVFDVKPPPTHLVHAAALALFGHSMMSIRILDLGWQTITAVMLFALARTFGLSRTNGFLAAGSYALLYFSFDFWHTAQTDGFLVLPTVVAVFFFRRAATFSSTACLFLAGMAAGCAALFKYPIGVLGLVLSALAVSTRRRVTDGALVLLGMAIAALVLSALLAWQGGLSDFLFIQRHYIDDYGFRQHAARTLVAAARRAVRLAVGGRSPTGMTLAFCGLVLVVFELARRLARQPALAVVSAWSVAALVHLLVQNKLYTYHCLPLLAPAALQLGWIVDEAGRRLERWPLARRSGTAAAWVALGVVLVPPQLPRHERAWNVVRGTLSLRSAYIAWDDLGMPWRVYDYLEVGDYLHDRAPDGGTALVWAFEPEIYFVSGLRPASRFVYNFPLYGRFWWRDRRAVLIDELRATRPAFVVVGRNDPIPATTGTSEDSYQALLNFPELRAHVDACFVADLPIGDYLIYRRRPGPGAGCE